MPARNGADYVESLKKHAPRVYLDGRRVADVTAEPIFREPIRAIAEQYDMQLDPAYRDVMTYPSPTTGDPVSTSFLVPDTREHLVKKRKHFKLRADHNFGFMGRAPDFMNQFVTGWHLVADRFARAGARFGENATRYYEYIREHDLFLTHMLINPQIDRSKTSAQQEDPFLHLGRVGETRDGIIVRGAKMLGTMAPITEEVAVIPFGGVPPGDDAYALVFGISTATPGLTFICRETVAPLPRSRFDHPLSSRFEEMDCIAVFDDVLIPWEHVFLTELSPEPVASPPRTKPATTGASSPSTPPPASTRAAAASLAVCFSLTRYPSAVGSYAAQASQMAADRWNRFRACTVGAGMT